MAKSIRMLLSRNDLTHEQLVKLSQWCNPWGMTWLSTSQISYLRTGTTKKIGPGSIDALGQVNLRLAEAAGATGPLIAELPPFEPIPKTLGLPEVPFYLRHPNSGEPIDAGGLYLIWLGRLEPEGVSDGHVSDMEARRLSANLARLAQAWARDHRMTIGQAMNELLQAYGVDDERRQRRLREVVVGLTEYTGAEFSEELPALGAVLGAMEDSGRVIEPGDVRARLYRLPQEP
ncbi:MAG: hypothetical protein KGO47_07270 [Cyanobacteria bacterium REEB417]|nr:hypothetical protein [Cyanobacteria bacterium REEB417]